MSVHFNDRDTSKLKQMLAPHIKAAVMLTEPTPRSRREVIERFDALWPLICAAHYDLGWPWMRVRDRLSPWMVRIVLSLPVDLDEENRGSTWTKTPRRDLQEGSAEEGRRRPSFQIGSSGGE